MVENIFSGFLAGLTSNPMVQEGTSVSLHLPQEDGHCSGGFTCLLFYHHLSCPHREGGDRARTCVPPHFPIPSHQPPPDAHTGHGGSSAADATDPTLFLWREKRQGENPASVLPGFLWHEQCKASSPVRVPWLTGASLSSAGALLLAVTALVT